MMPDDKWRAEQDASILMAAKEVELDAARRSAAAQVIAEKKAILDGLAKDSDSRSKGRVTLEERDGNIIPKFD